MARTISVLCVQGVGHEEADPDLQPSWSQAISAALRRWDPEIAADFDFLHYDALFEHAPHNPLTYGEAMVRLLASSIVHGIGDLFTRQRTLFQMPEQVRWTAGMVAQRASEDDLREQTRQAVLDQLKGRQYDLVCAHSLGSLICYDTLHRFAQVFGDRHPVRSPQPPAQPERHRLSEHSNAAAAVWREVSGILDRPALRDTTRAFQKLQRKPERRTLLIGINDYPDLANRLEDCVNDVFLMSAVLQECGVVSRMPDRKACRCTLYAPHPLREPGENDGTTGILLPGGAIRSGVG